MNITNAILLATQLHQGQKDKAGEEYILHPLRIMLKMNTEEERIVAVLHDVVEDTSATLEILKEQGFSERVIEAVHLLTKDGVKPYLDYLKDIAGNKIARKVKIADLQDNMDINRLKDDLTEKDLKRLNKYRNSLKFLLHS
jgi:(p)ppGpp synthase/HD superfamily hydrolase